MQPSFLTTQQRDHRESRTHDQCTNKRRTNPRDHATLLYTQLLFPNILKSVNTLCLLVYTHRNKSAHAQSTNHDGTFVLQFYEIFQWILNYIPKWLCHLPCKLLVKESNELQTELWAVDSFLKRFKILIVLILSFCVSVLHIQRYIIMLFY